MTSVFFLAADLGPAAGPLAVLAACLPRDRFRVTAGVVGRAEGPAEDALLRADVPILPLPVKYLFDLTGARAFRQAVVAVNPAVVHAWGPTAARAARLVTAGENGPRLVVSGAADCGHGVAGWLTRRAVRRADRVVPRTWAEGSCYRNLRVRGEALTRIAPGVPTHEPSVDPAAVKKELGLSPAARVILAGDRLDPAAGLKDAIWAFDILRYDTPDLYLVLAGDGPERVRLDEFGRALAFDDYRVRFAGPRTDVLDIADVVWATRAADGLDLPLAAMAAGRPVVGWQTPDLAEAIDHGETGWLVPPGDRAQLAAKTRPLLDKPELGRLVGGAARRRVSERFPAARVVEQFARLYEELAGERGASPEARGQ